jgi:hypothetical protein
MTLKNVALIVELEDALPQTRIEINQSINQIRVVAEWAMKTVGSIGKYSEFPMCDPETSKIVTVVEQYGTHPLIDNIEDRIE